MPKQITITEGNVGRNSGLQYTTNGTPVATLSLAESFNTYNHETREWTRGETTWYNVIVYNNLALTVAEKVQKGHRIGVVGEVKTETYRDKTTGEQKTSQSIIAKEIHYILRPAKNETPVKTPVQQTIEEDYSPF